uniref:Uncharacterized protein n=1 Tax=Arundo donax TaxID=35708 RepID=A0A0A9C3N1_ARUDO
MKIKRGDGMQRRWR